MDRREDWSFQDLEIIKRSDIHLEEMAKLTGRTVDAVRQKRYMLRIKNAPGTGGDETSFEQSNDFINIICASKRVLSQDDIIKQFKVDMTIWEVDRFKVKTSEGYRKDRSVKWQVEDGKVLKGDVNDTGKMLVVPMYHIELRLIKKKDVAEAKTAIDELIADAKKFHPEYKTAKYKNLDGDYMYEIDLPDIHFGRLSWWEESGENYDLKLATNAIDDVLEKLISYSAQFHPQKILLPLGNDFFNADNEESTTTKGTPQQEDVRWQKTFKRGREVCVKMIDRCASVAPTDVLVIPGNHDRQRSFYLGDALACWYHDAPGVTINNESKARKYYRFGGNLIGFTHGSEEKLEKLPLVMAIEQPEAWAETKYREWHTGDKHYKKDTIYASNEGSGLMVRILRSLAVADAWTFNKGLVGALRSAESFLWHNKDGLIAQFTATPETPPGS